MKWAIKSHAERQNNSPTTHGNARQYIISKSLYHIRWHCLNWRCSCCFIMHCSLVNGMLTLDTSDTNRSKSKTKTKSKRVNLKSNYTYRNATEILPEWLHWMCGLSLYYVCVYLLYRVVVAVFIIGCLTTGWNKCNSLWKVIFRNNQQSMMYAFYHHHFSSFGLLSLSLLILSFLFYSLSQSL